MSQAARITLGVAMLLIAAGFMALVPFMNDVSPQAGPGMAICGLFSGLIAVACLSTASQPVTIRIIGGTVFLLSALYILNQVLAFSSIGDELVKCIAERGVAKIIEPASALERNNLDVGIRPSAKK